MIPCGYAGKILRVNLSDRTFLKENLDNDYIHKYIGGAGFGALYLNRENPPSAKWSDPENRIIFSNGPLSGTVIRGSGTICVTSKGPMTDLAGSTQANGTMGAFLRSCGYDGIIIQGHAESWSYLLLSEEKAELRNASDFVGKDTQETQELIRKELQAKAGISVFCIGPAAENRVRFSVIIGDGSHTASKNGLGAVLAAKKIKAIVILRGKFKAQTWNEQLLKEVSKELYQRAMEYRDGLIHKWGTNGSFTAQLLAGCLPVKNYTTDLFPCHEKMNGQYIRTHFEKKKRVPCYNCGMNHNLIMKVTEGPYKDFVGEEPEYESFAAFGPQIGQTDAGAVFILTDLADRLGIDVNETGWVIGWLMECYEKGILTKNEIDGIEMDWGNVESVRKILIKIAKREGIGDLLAEGVKRASEKIGGEASEMAVCTRKGSTPRGHDHRARWSELLDTCLSNTSTLEATYAGVRPEELGMPPLHDMFSPYEVPTINALINGWHIFEDCAGACRFNLKVPELLIKAINAATDFNLSLPESIRIGKRVVNTLRIFNIKSGLTPDLEAPSPRYGSTPIDGPAKGFGVMKYWTTIVEVYYQLMGWDPSTGKPTPKTLKDLDLENLISEL